ncbi:MAG: cytochrome c family protein [gamma proteobacterium endosymbiont of Lamellibrachia anaximandri]|nr:cytochrome c family protein [gamma proteobacterium endosymbiont of Lamellibrachia anaximandri]MBL3617499.1 cytochrome c family protein [gamma proteobacterium endosymbiont of Lamellibrachia anaximandri]
MHNKTKKILVLSVLLGWFGQIAGVAAEPVHHISSETCKSCHKEIYKQWKGSMHANSTALKDPIHGTFYRKVVGDPTKEGVTKKGKYPVCLQCHAPNAARDKMTKLDAKPAYSEGVNCVGCHLLEKYNGIEGKGGKLMLGMKSYKSSDQLQGPQGFNRGLEKLTASNDVFGGAGGGDDSKPNPHLGSAVTLDGKEVPSMPMKANASLMKSNEACMGCHDQRNNSHGVPLCATGNEYVDSQSDVTCQYCHMPMVGKLADHSMGGGHHEGMLKRSLIFTLDAQPKGGKLMTTAKLKNQQPHSLPTGAPFRNIFLKVSAYDAEGNLVWENAKGHPGKADPKAYLAYRLKDEKGDPTIPPKATQLGEDSRLKPHEERAFSYEIPSKGVVLVRGEVYYNLLWNTLQSKFKHLPEDLRTPQLISTAEVTL